MTDETSSRWLIYGAYGYTGELIARLAAEQGLAPVLSGRSADKLAPLAEELGLQPRPVGLDDPAALDAALDGIDVVVHCAGPFSRTSTPMVDACIRTGTHYTDLTGEIEVFEACAARDGEAREAGIMLMPGTGFDVVPSDCLAAHLKARLPDATGLALGFAPRGAVVSRGTATTTVENLHRGTVVRRGGRLEQRRSGSMRRSIDFGRGPWSAMAVPWGDVSTAYHSTGIPDIEVYLAAPRSLMAAAWVSSWFGWLVGSGPVQSYLKGVA